jgi:hypothetical protein
MVRASLRLGISLAVAASASGCLTPQSDAEARLVSAAATATTTAGLTADLYLVVSSAWETTPTMFDTQITCTIPSGSGTVSSTCAGTIPEGQLHFSKLKFTVGTTNPSICKQLIFRPYYFIASTAGAYTPEGSTSAVDCSVGAPDDVGCYGGNAKEIVPSFPTYTGRYFLTAEGLETSYTISSANEVFGTTNRYTCNNKVDQTAAVAGYVANSMANYVVECRDQYYTLTKRITLTLGDADLEAGETPGAANDDYDDWLAP